MPISDAFSWHGSDGVQLLGTYDLPHAVERHD